MPEATTGGMPAVPTGEVFKGFVSSTARTMLAMSRQHLNLGKESPAVAEFLKVPVIRYTLLNAKTAQLNNEFSALPEVSIVNENLQAGLGKLKAIAGDPTAKGTKEQAKVNFDLFTSSYKKPADNVQLDLATVQTLREAAYKLGQDQYSAMLEIIKTVKTASSPQDASQSSQIRDIFSVLDKQREKISGSLKAVTVTLKSTYTTLSTLYRQVYSSIPATERAGVPTLGDQDQHRNVRE